MLIILYYCLKVIVCSGLLYGYYLLALRNNRFHQWNRYYLLAVVFVSITLPLLRIPIFFDSDSSLIAYNQILSGPDVNFDFVQKQQQFHLTLPLLLLAGYFLITVFFLFLFTRNILRIYHLKKSYPGEQMDDVCIYRTQEAGTPFSFFKNIFWNTNIQLNTEKGRQMLEHELTHVHQKHSVDKVTMEVLMAFAWWNPFLYFIRKELSVIHEFIADQKASAGDAKLQYASLLLMKVMGSQQYALGNPFFHTQLKRRLTMLTTINNPKFSYLRRLIALPLVCILTVLFAVQCERTHEDIKAPLQSKESTVQQDVKSDSSTNMKLPANALYIINGAESSKEEVGKLNPGQITSINVLKGDVAIKEYGSRGTNGVILISTRQSRQEVATSKTDEPALFPGGLDGWRRYLSSNLKYPEAAQEKGTQGVVRMQMVVNENGNITEIKPLNDPGDGLAAEAVRMIEKGPKWIPAKHNGKPVTYKFVQTITFQLQ